MRRFYLLLSICACIFLSNEAVAQAKPKISRITLLRRPVHGWRLVQAVNKNGRPMNLASPAPVLHLYKDGHFTIVGGSEESSEMFNQSGQYQLSQRPENVLQLVREQPDTRDTYFFIRSISSQKLVLLDQLGQVLTYNPAP